MYPCFRGLVLNVVLDVFLPLIGVWLQGQRRQLGETALPLMNSSSSNPPKRPVDTTSLPVNKASHQLRLCRALTDKPTAVCSSSAAAAAARHRAGFIPACLPHSDDFSVPTWDFQSDSALHLSLNYSCLLNFLAPLLCPQPITPRTLIKFRTVTFLCFLAAWAPDVFFFWLYSEEFWRVCHRKEVVWCTL